MKTNITKLVVNHLCSNVLGEVAQLESDLKNATVAYSMVKQAMLDMKLDIEFAKHGATIAVVISLKAQNGEIYLQWAKENGADTDGDFSYVLGRVPCLTESEVKLIKIVNKEKVLNAYESFCIYTDKQ